MVGRGCGWVGNGGWGSGIRPDNYKTGIKLYSKL